MPTTESGHPPFLTLNRHGGGPLDDGAPLRLLTKAPEPPILLGKFPSKPSIDRGRLPRLAMFLPSLEGGGAEHMMVNLLCGLNDVGIPVDLLLAQAVGPFLSDVPRGVRIIDLSVRKVRHAIRPLARYLRSERPHALLSRMTHANVAAIAARLLSRVDTRVVVVEASNLSANVAFGRLPLWYIPLVRLLYPRADAIVAVSHGVADDLHRLVRLPRQNIRVIYNPVVDASLASRSAAEPDHPWLRSAELPVFLSVGRLDIAKDHENLLRAFAMVRRTRPARLLILGEGEERGRIESLRAELGLVDHVQLPGFSHDALTAMRHAAAFVLSSRFEGLPNALIEALAVGCPVVSTACPSGPEEVLGGGKYGLLVPTEDPHALAQAMLTALDHPWNRDELRERGQSFSLANALPQYLDAVDYPAAMIRSIAAA